MSGRAYTMKEMKEIVDYLVENNCYSLYRGRRMWVDYANSDKTIRTWQSLKETFLKRILPDIHNPYYKLHHDKIRSFRVGEDVTGKPKNKLEFQTASEDSSNVQEKASTSRNESNEASKGPGEKIQASSNRESVETIILGYDEPAPTKAVATPAKMSLRDRIQYADEPVVHIIRDILHDFSASDEEQTENQDEKSKSNKATKDTTPSKNKGSNNEEKKESPSKKSLRLKKKENKNENITKKEDIDKEIVTRNCNQTVISPNNNVTVGKQDISADQSATTSSMPDSLLPNNPEALKDKNSTKKSNETVEQPKAKSKSDDSSTKVTRKRIREPSVSSDSILADAPINHTGSPKKEAPNPEKNKPIITTIVVNDSEELNTDGNKITNVSSQQSTNPCLQSVRLSAEQFLEPNSDSHSDINANSNSSHSKDLAEKSPTILKPVPTIDKKVASKVVVVLESHSESASDDNTQPEKQESVRARKTQLRGNSKLINNLFGSTSGGGVKRKRHSTCSHRNRVNRHYVQSSGSSEWTSESDSDGFVSPPRSRSRLARKYANPQSSRILSLEERGGLFIVSGKKVFPLVKFGKSVGTHLTYLPERDSDEEKESYWQLKYLEERKKSAELIKLMQQKRGEINQTESGMSVAGDSPILQTIPSKKQKSIVIDDNNSDPKEEDIDQAISPAPKEIEEEMTLKIKFAKDKVVKLKGYWPNLRPMLGELMQLLKQQGTERAPSPGALADDAEAEDIHKKVDELEAKIFEEIEELDANERLQDKEEMEKNITERRKRGRAKLSTTPTEPAARASKRLKGSAESGVALPSGPEVLVPEDTDTRRTRNKLSDDNANSTTSKDVASTLPKRKSNTKSKPNDETPGRKSITRQLAMKLNGTPQGKTSTEGLEKNGVASAKGNDESLNENDGSRDGNEAPVNEGEAAINEDSQILYKFPSPVPEKKPVGRPKKHRNFRRTPNIYSSPENISHQSADSSQGYQDSDNSPLSGRFRRKKKFSLPTNSYKTRKYNRLQRRKTLIHLECDASSESSNTSFGIPAQSITIQNSSLTSDVYRSESYQLLMPLARSFRPLEKISESSPCPNVVDSQHNSLDLSPASQNMESCSLKSHSNDIEVGNSSNVTLPMSPELSIVENISVAKDTLSGNFPTINESQKNCGGTYDNQYDISEVDVSVPLMEQDCTFRMNYQTRQTVSHLSVDMHTQHPDSTDIDVTDTIPATGTGVTVSQSLLEKIDTVSIEAQTTSDSLDTRLGNLLLESARKIALQNKMIVDAQSQQTEHVKEEPTELKSRSKKRCSTPCKRKVPKKPQPPINPVIEEQMEFCSSGRKSCPPVISVFCAENPTVDPNRRKTAPAPTVATRKPRRVKEIIKVKILRPKIIKQGKKNRSTLSVQTDSGINDTTTSGILHSFNSSVELIHNHSETCVHAQECLHCSVEFVENSPQSIICLDSSSMQSVEIDKENLRNVAVNKSLCAQFFSTDAQDASCLTIGSGMTSRSSGAAHVSGTSMNSLMTDDLSPPHATPRSPCSWRLLSEDEDSLSPDPLAPAAAGPVVDGDPTSYAITNHSGDSTGCAKNNNFGDPTGCANTVGYGSNLRQLFPIACAVPDLSTITEQSRETDCNSLGFKMDTNTGNEFLALDNLIGNQEEFFTRPSDI